MKEKVEPHVIKITPTEWQRIKDIATGAGLTIRETIMFSLLCQYPDYHPDLLDTTNERPF